MGCSQSKIDNEESVLRCKERKRFMKDAVVARNAFAAAHSGYSMSLKSTGAALCDYVLADFHDPRPFPPPPLDPLLPPPMPPMPIPDRPSLHRAASMPEFAIPKADPKAADTIQEEDDEDVQPDDPDAGDLSVRGRRSGGSAAEVVAPPPPPSPPPDPPAASESVPLPPPEHKDGTFDYIFSPVQYMAGPSLSEIDEIRAEKDVSEAQLKKSEGLSEKVEGFVDEKVVERAPVVKNVKKSSKQMVKMPVEVKRGGKSGSIVGLFPMLHEIDEQFLKASESAYEASMMLEANRLHYHSNFADNRGYIDHSARLMRVITWNRSIKGLQTAEEANDDFTENEMLATVLDKLLAWEKMLYDEVKAGEHMKLEYERKVALMNKQKKHSTNSVAYEKAKAAVTQLHTRYIVDMQSMDSTVSEISHLRDDDLYPKLLSLVDGMAKMWETMHVHHKNQMKIVEDIKSLDVSQSPKETSEEHYKRTAQLQDVITGWHSQFEMLVTHLKKYIIALHSWLKLNLIPIESNLKEKVSSPPRVLNPPIQALIRAWSEQLEKLPFEIARNAISSFGAVILSIKLHQEDEGKLKLKCEQRRKELARKTRAFEDWYRKYEQNRIPPDEVNPEVSRDAKNKDAVAAERQLEVEILKKMLEEELEEHQRHYKQNREKSLGSLKTHLPELFRALTDFSLASSDMYKELQAVAHSEKLAKKPS